MKKIKIKNSKWKEYTIISIFILGMVFLFMYVTGIIQSGYHLLDDHEFYVVGKLFPQNGFWQTLISEIKYDLNFRFRPLYRFFRTIGIYFWGTNWKLWYLGRMLQVSCTLILFYIFARERGANIVLSLIFGLLILFGEQSSGWWRLGPQEGLGIMLMACSFVTTLLLGRRNTIQRKLLFIVSLILLSLQKESFLMTVPAFFVLLLVQEIHEKQIDDEENYLIIFSKFVKRHKSEVIIILVILLIEAYVIINYVGTNTIVYAGYSNELPIVEYFHGMINILKTNGFKYLILVVISNLFLQIEMKRENCSKILLFEIVFCLYIFITQLFLHAMSGMWERYLIPWVVSISYFVVIIGFRIMEKNSRLILAYIGILILFFIETNVVELACDFSEEGNDIRNCAYFIEEYSNSDALIMATANGHEKNMAFLMFMEEEYGYNNKSEWSREIEELDIDKFKNADIIWGYNGTVYNVMKDDAGLNLDDYNVYMTSIYEVAIKKEVSN